jgi:hypothetical protein
MRVLLKKSEHHQDIECTICGQCFRLFWERSSEAERATMRAIVQGELRHQHHTDRTTAAHPSTPFHLPDWPSTPQYAGAALVNSVSRVREASTPIQLAPKRQHAK